MICHIGALFLLYLFCGFHHNILDKLQFLLIANQRDHDFRYDIIALFLCHFNGSFHDRTGLHPGNFRISNRQTAATMTHHRVEFMQLITLLLYFFRCHTHILCQCFNVCRVRGNELMQRRIQITHRHRTAFQCLIHALEVSLLERQNLCQCSLTLLHGIRQNHLADLRNTLRIKEHVLGTAQTNAFCTQTNRIGCILRGICIGADGQLTEAVCPCHDTAEVTAYRCFYRGDHALINLAGGAVKGNFIAFMEGIAAQGKFLCILINLDVTAAGYTAGTHTAGYYCCMGSHAAANGQDAFCCMHAFNVLRRGFQTHQNNLFPLLLMGILRVICGKVNLTSRSTRRCGQCFTDNLAALQCLCIKGRMQQLIQALCLNAQNCFFRCNSAFIHQITGNLHSCRCGTLAVSCLQEEQIAFLDGEFHILHVAVMVFQTVGNVHKLCITLRQILCQLGDRLRSTDAGYNVFALGINQVLAKNTLFAGGRVTGKCHAGTGGITHVAEYHGLDIDCGTPVTRDIIHTTVYNGTWVIPGTEYCLDSLHQLYLRVLRELLAHFFLINCLIPCDDLLQVLCGQVSIIFCTLGFLDFVQNTFKDLFAHLHNDIGEHLDKPTVRIVSKPRIAGFLCKAFDRNIIQAKVQNGIHHARHRCPGTGAYRYQQRIGLIAELLAPLFLQHCQCCKNLILNLL